MEPQQRPDSLVTGCRSHQGRGSCAQALALAGWCEKWVSWQLGGRNVCSFGLGLEMEMHTPIMTLVYSIKYPEVL